jgi:hypothetical protein
MSIRIVKVASRQYVVVVKGWSFVTRSNLVGWKAAHELAALVKRNAA